jgi:hypothetical protein
MKTTVENLLLIEGTEIIEYPKHSLVIIYKDDIIQIFYRFYKNTKYSTDVFIEDVGTGNIIDLQYFDDVKNVINQVYYITGKKIKIKKKIDKF